MEVTSHHLNYLFVTVLVSQIYRIFALVILHRIVSPSDDQLPDDPGPTQGCGQVQGSVSGLFLMVDPSCQRSQS